MSGEIEYRNGVKCMVWNGERPWHWEPNDTNNFEGCPSRDVSGLQLTPMQMLEKAQCDWTVSLVPSYSSIKQLVNNQADIDAANKYNQDPKNKKKKIVPEFKEEWKQNRVKMKTTALVRDLDGKILDEVTDKWNPVQNHEAMDFFNDFVSTGDMEMETVGSLKGGQIVWGLARINQSFELFKGDKVQSYLLFSNFHKYGHSTTVMFTPVRVVCNNTLTMAMGDKVAEMFKYSHRRKFKPDDAKKALGVSQDLLNDYEKKAIKLGAKKAKDQDIIEYLKTVLPGQVKTDKKGKDSLGEMARWAYDRVDVQPGHQYAEGSWWQAFNAVTLTMDHQVSKTNEQRLKQGWFGTHKTIKMKALDKALEFAAKSPAL